MEDGVWRTVSGRRIFIKEGESISEAMRNSGKFSKPSQTLSNYKNKDEFINYIEDQTKIKLTNDKDNFMNNKRNSLYTEIDKEDQLPLFSFLKKQSIKYEQHLGNKYWIYIK